MILPVGPMGMYRTVVSRLKSARVKCDHVTTFNMDEWSDRAGETMRGNQPGGLFVGQMALVAQVAREIEDLARHRHTTQMLRTSRVFADDEPAARAHADVIRAIGTRGGSATLR